MSEEGQVTKTQVRQELDARLDELHKRIKTVGQQLMNVIMNDSETIEYHEWENDPHDPDIKRRVLVSLELRVGVAEHIATVDASLSALERDIEELDMFWDEQY